MIHNELREHRKIILKCCAKNITNYCLILHVHDFMYAVTTAIYAFFAVCKCDLRGTAIVSWMESSDDRSCIIINTNY